MKGEHRIELVRHHTPGALRGLVAGIVGLSERAPSVVRRRQPAGTLVPLVLSFGNPLTVDSLADATGAGRSYGSFIAGLSTGPADTRFDGGQDCVQVYLTPVGVGRLLGVPGREVAHRVVAIEDVVKEMGDPLADRLHSALTWKARFDAVEDLLLERSVRTDGPPAWVAGMWQDIQDSGGRVRIGDLVAATGWSHRYVSSMFTEHIGLSPKQAAGLVRFERATAELESASMVELAARHGYADQSHFSREVARYAGEPPSQLVAARRPTPAMALGQ